MMHRSLFDLMNISLSRGVLHLFELRKRFCKGQRHKEKRGDINRIILLHVTALSKITD